MVFNKKILVYLLLGLICSAIICLVIGLILYITAEAEVILQSAPNYSQLLQNKALKMFVGTALIIVGSVCFSVPSLILLVLLTKKAFTEHKNKI